MVRRGRLHFSPSSYGNSTRSSPPPAPYPVSYPLWRGGNVYFSSSAGSPAAESSSQTAGGSSSDRVVVAPSLAAVEAEMKKYEEVAAGILLPVCRGRLLASFRSPLPTPTPTPVCFLDHACRTQRSYSDLDASLYLISSTCRPDTVMD